MHLHNLKTILELKTMTSRLVKKEKKNEKICDSLRYTNFINYLTNSCATVFYFTSLVYNINKLQ